MAIRFDKKATTAQLVIEMDDEMSFALVDLLLQALMQWVTLPTPVKERLDGWRADLRAMKVERGFEPHTDLASAPLTEVADA